MPKYYVTKYALSDGIEEMELRPSIAPNSDGYLCGEGWSSFKLGRDAFETRDDAVKAANAARIKKIASLQKQIEKLEKLAFDDL